MWCSKGLEDMHRSPTGHDIVVDVSPTKVVTETGTLCTYAFHLQRR